jgi:hypothetical protein
MDHDGSVPSASSETEGVTINLERDQEFKFTHPAGLQIARHLTKSVIEAMGIRMWMDSDGTLRSAREENLESSVFSNPEELVESEVTADLETILTFENMPNTTTERSEAGSSALSLIENIATGQQRPDGTDFLSDSLINPWTTEGDSEMTDSSIFDFPPSLSSHTLQMAQQQPIPTPRNRNTDDDQASYENAQFSVVTRPPSAELSRSAFDLPQPRTLYSQPQQDTNLLSGSYHRHSEGNTIPEGTVYHQKPPRLPSPLHPTRPVQSSDSGQFSPSLQLPKIDLPPLDRASVGQPNFSENRRPLPSIATSDNTNRIPLNQFHNIKSFLPVNKSMDSSKSLEKTSSLPQPFSSSSSSFGIDDVPTNAFQAPHLLAGKQAASPPTKQTTADKYSLSANSAGSTQSTPTAQFFSQTLYDFSSGAFHTTTMGKRSAEKMAPKKRKTKEGAESGAKKQKLDKKGKAVRKDPEGEGVSFPRPFPVCP